MELKEKYDVFDRYLDQELSPQEKENFLMQLSSDQELQAELAEYKRLIISSKEAEKQQFRNHLLQVGRSLIREEEQSYQNSPSQGKVRTIGRKNLFYRIAAAATVLVLMLPASLYFYSSYYLPSLVYDQHYRPYENVIAPSMRGAEEQNIQSDIQETLASYTSEDYSKAVKDIESFLASNPNSDKAEQIRLFLGISYLETHRTDEAVQAFKETIQNQGRFQDQARWYLGLTYLKSGEIEQARKHFEILAQKPDSSSYEEKAEQLLEKL